MPAKGPPPSSSCPRYDRHPHPRSSSSNSTACPRPLHASSSSPSRHPPASNSFAPRPPASSCDDHRPPSDSSGTRAHHTDATTTLGRDHARRSDPARDHHGDCSCSHRARGRPDDRDDPALLHRVHHHYPEASHCHAFRCSIHLILHLQQRQRRVRIQAREVHEVPHEGEADLAAPSCEWGWVGRTWVGVHCRLTREAAPS